MPTSRRRASDLLRGAVQVKITTFVGRIVERHAVAILIVVLALSAFAVWSVTGMSVVTTQNAFLSAKSEAYRGYQDYEKAFGGDSMLILIPGTPLELATPEALKGFTELETKLRADPRIRSVVSPLTPCSERPPHRAAST
jgi:predicted RND superfamily exporter protein